MLSVTRLLCGTVTPSDVLRYGARDTRRSPAHMLHYSKDKRPVVAWNVTRRCNLRCVHCYADSEDRDYSGELTTQEALAVIDDLAGFKVPTILFSGGEPLLRKDILELAHHAAGKGIRTVLSTNGTAITPKVAEKIKEAGFAYVGVSIDGIGEKHDWFRQQEGCFDRAIQGIKNCREIGIRVGLRFTLSGLNKDQLPDVLTLLETHDIPRCCVYHLAYAGRGDRISGQDVSLEETREAVDHIFERALDFHRRGIEKEILTVDNHTDNVYLYLRLLRDDPQRAKEVYQMLEWNGGNQSGIAVGEIDWYGNVHPDQFTLQYSLGNVRERKFSEIWRDESDPILGGLRDRKGLLKGRCGACKFQNICNGNLRIRAWSATGDFWAPDPACYLTDEEIGVTSEETEYEIDENFRGSEGFVKSEVRSQK
ncbi:MAG: radical SAM protein [Planctomycetota bacterium]